MADLREVLDEALDAQSETIKNLVEEAFKYERRKDIWVSVVCKHCGKMARYPVTVELPDYKERVKALDLLMTQAKGKPKETVRHDVVISTTNVENMSLAELEAEERRILEAHPDLNRDEARDLDRHDSEARDLGRHDSEARDLNGA